MGCNQKEDQITNFKEEEGKAKRRTMTEGFDTCWDGDGRICRGLDKRS